MSYTDLSYYKLNVHLQIPLVWSKRLQAQSRVLQPFVHGHISCFQSFRKAGLVL